MVPGASRIIFLQFDCRSIPRTCSSLTWRRKLPGSTSRVPKRGEQGSRVTGPQTSEMGTSLRGTLCFCRCSLSFSVPGGSLNTAPFLKNPQDPLPAQTRPWVSTKIWRSACAERTALPWGEPRAVLEAGHKPSALPCTTDSPRPRRMSSFSPGLYLGLAAASAPHGGAGGFIRLSFWWDLCIVIVLWFVFFLKKKKVSDFMPVS